MYVLIDNDDMEVLKVGDDINGLVELADILIPDNDFLILDITPESFDRYIDRDINTLYFNCTGKQAEAYLSYSRKIDAIIEYISSLKPDETPMKKKKVSSSKPATTTVHKRPASGTLTGKVWEIADKVFKDDAEYSRQAVIDACIEEGINQSTAATQYSKWKKFKELKKT